MQPELISVHKLFIGEQLYTVPLFQRPYVWDENRWGPFWEDVARVADENFHKVHKWRPHFLGSIVLQPRTTRISEGGGPRWEVIDGQQRLITLQVLLKAVADVFASEGAPNDVERPLRRLLHDEDGAPANPDALKVWPTNIDRDRFFVVMSEDSTKKWENPSSFTKCYDYFHRSVLDWLADSGEDPVARTSRVKALSYTLRHGLSLVVLYLSPDDPAQVIFETLNARGTPLLPADLIKNLLLRRAEDEGADTAALYERYWRIFDIDERYWRQKVGSGHTARPRVDLFLMQFLTAKTRAAVSPAHLYESFADWLDDAGKAQKTEQHMEDVLRFANIYHKLDTASDIDRDRVVTCAARLREMDFTTAMPVLLYLCADPKRSRSDAAQIVAWIESFLVRRMVCGLNTRGYSTLFVDLLAEIACQASDTPAAPLVAEFLLRSRTDSARWPDDTEFGGAWRSQPLYIDLKRDRLTMMLRAIERALRGPSHDPVPVPRTLQIEHILPQNWRRAHWPLDTNAGSDAEAMRDAALHTIGNLTLLAAKLNQGLSDAPWSEKRAALQKYGLLVLNNALTKYNVWDECAISDRGEMLLQKALGVWPRPADAYQMVQHYATEPEVMETSSDAAATTYQPAMTAIQSSMVQDWGLWNEASIPASNAGIVNLKRRIDALVERGDLSSLELIRDSDDRGVTFKGAKASDEASTYYRRAGKYLRAHIARLRDAMAEHQSRGPTSGFKA